MRMKIAYFDCFMGISGDMTIGALIDAGADPSLLMEKLGTLGLDGYTIDIAKKITGHIEATDINVILENRDNHPKQGNGDGHHHEHRHLPEITEIINSAELSGRVKQTAISIFERLAKAEAKVHGSTPEKIHFHEVGAIDAIVDIVGSAICLELLDWPKVISSPMPTFHGYAKGSHGIFPLPAPAAAEILRGVPWRTLDIEGELVTPTGAAIIAEIASDFGGQPPMKIERIGYGAGKTDFGRMNALRVMIGEQFAGESDCVTVIETNIDDLNPEFYESVMEKLFAAGAFDVFLTPIQMKKSRPAVILSTICSPPNGQEIATIILRETSAFGVRMSQKERICLKRRTEQVTTEFGAIKVKIGEMNDQIMSVSPEYNDCKKAASEHNVPIKMVYDAVKAASRIKTEKPTL
jgi:pyridinium-3,5-bisthiocarboxylic acid mononucleotide nickel chelatase